MLKFKKFSESVELDEEASNLHTAYSDISESDGGRYGVFSKGGSIGQNSNKPPVKVFSNADEAKEYAKRMRAALSPGERNDYGMSYIVKKVNESVELDEANVKKGDSVKIINAKKYDALAKPEVSGIVIGMAGSKVMVKVGSGQMNVDPKDLVKESVELDEATDFRPGDTVYQVGSKLKGTVLHKGLPDKVDENRYSPLQQIRKKKEAEDRKKKDDTSDSQYQRMVKKQYGGMMGGLKKEEVELDEVKVKNSNAAMDLEKEISDLEKRISKLTPLARKDDDANMQLVRAKSRLKQKQEKHKQLMKEEAKLGEASNEGTIRIIDLGKNKGFQVQSMTNGKFVNVGKPYKDLKSAEEFKHLSYFSQSMSPQARASRAARDLLNKESVELGESPFDAYKRDFKSREMDYELRDEKPDSKGKKHIVTIKGKAWKTFASHDQALKAARTLTNKGVQASVRMESVDLEDVKLHEAGSPDRLAIIKKAAQKVKARQAAADKKAMQAAKRDMKSPGAQRGMAPLKKDLDESRNEALKALEDLVKKGGVDKADFQKAHDLYKAAKINDLRKHISSLDTDPGEAIARAISRRDSKTFNSMYPRAKAGDYFANIIANHGSKLKEAKGSKYDAYHKDFSTAVQYARKEVEKQGYEIDDDEWFRKVGSGPKKPSVGKTNKYSIDLMKNDKDVKQKLNMQVYGMDNGKYELNMYVS